jgi:hypothetical protein
VISHLLIPEENAKCACKRHPQPSFIGKKFKESKVDGFERRYPMQDLDMRKTSLVSVPRGFASSYSREMQDALANAIHSHPSLEINP